MTPFFSIIIPVYNVAPYLRTCLDSVFAAEKVLRQSQDAHVRELGVEVICIDDGSTDGSGGILDEYARRTDARSQTTFTAIHLKNGGPGAARNAGLDRTNGEYVLFVDSDDAVVPWWLIDLVPILLEKRPDLLRFDYLTVFQQDEPVKRMGKCTQTSYHFQGENRLEVARVARQIGSMYLWRSCFRRAVIGDTRFSSLQHGEDILFVASVFKKVNHYVSINDPLYRYFQRSGSTMHSEVSLKFVMQDVLSTRMRHEIMSSWEQYPMIKSEHLKGMKHEFAVKAHWIGGLSVDDAKAAKQCFFTEGAKVFAEGFISKIFQWRSWCLFCLIYRLNWWLRSTLLKCSWIRTLNDIVRGRGNR